MTSRIWNYSAGPGALPVPVLERCRDEMLNWHSAGMGVMEMSHRGKAFESIAKKAEDDLRHLLAIPANYKVLFLQGGAYGCFAHVPLNMCKGAEVVDYVVTGHWSKAAAEEAKKYVKVNVAANTAASKFTMVPPVAEWKLSPNATYLHITSNETIHGVEMDLATLPNHPCIIADMSSDFLSRPVDVSKFGVIYAGAQKNMGPAGVAVVIIREDLLKNKKMDMCPSVWDWELQAKNDSMFNTPNTWAMYVCGLVYEWLLNLGGLPAIQAINRQKAACLYDAIAASGGYYISPVEPSVRSLMNIPFRITVGEELEKKFVKEAEAAGLVQLAGHRSVGGLRASFYNAITLEGAQHLVAFMAAFKAKYPATAPAPAAAAPAAPAAPKAA